MVQNLGRAAVFGPLVMVGLSVTAAWLVLDIWVRYLVAARQTRQFESELGEALHIGRVTDAVKLTRLYPRSPLALVLNASLGNCGAPAGFGFTPSLTARERAITAVTNKLKGGLWVLPAIARCLPLIGLLVTCDELNRSWRLEHIVWWLPWWVAVSVPTIWMHKYLSSRLESFKLEMDRLSIALLDQITSLSVRDRYQTGSLDPVKTSELTQPKVEQRPWPSAGLIVLNL